ncbi:MAG: thioredoxin family protein, partial [Alphaproteobacteria bacterium]|nr:thioredoxin family protein [Alphaproteobacteria bacterium]
SVQNNEELFISSPNRNLWLIILFAFIGGFILNLMPCVLPVLAIKLMSVINHAGAEKSRIRIGFMFNVLGIIFSFLVLAGLVIFLKHIKYAVGWGIHFQQPAFLVFLILVLVIFALNLFGVFEFSLPKFITNKVTVYKRGSPVSGEFFAGVLATLLATPCSAPFLGTAVAFSLAAGGLEVLVIFLFIGIGMSVPYLMIALFPHLVAFLPKSGKWMLSLKRILGLLLILTAVWLGFVLNTQLSGAEKSETSEAPEKLVWQKFDEEAMQQHLADGKIVFLDVTADWCLTCKANKLFTFNNKKVIQVLDVPEIVLMQADWTQSNEKISALLAKHGRYGIPFNVIYKQDREAVVLPELLTPSLVIKAIDKWKVEN